MKKGLIYFSITITLVALAGVFFILNNNRQYKGNSAIKGIPVDAAIIIRVSNIASISNLMLKNIDYSKELEKFSLSSKAYTLINQLDSLDIFTESTFEKLKQKQFFVSFHIQGRNKIEALLATSSNNRSEEKGISNWIKSLSDKGFIVTSKGYDAATIISIKKRESSNTYYISIFRGVVLESSSNLLVESAIRQLQSNLSLLTNSAFSKVFKTSGDNNPANLYLNFATMPHFLPSIFKDSKKIPSIFKTNNALWAELDVDIKSKEVMMNGFIAGESSSLINELFSGMKPQKPEIPNILPSNTRIYMSYCMESTVEFHKRFHSYLKKSGQDTKYFNIVNRIKKEKKIDIDKEFYSFIEGEMALVYTDLNPSSPDVNSFLIAETKGRSFSSDKMKRLLAALNSHTTTPIEYYKVDKDTSFPIYKGLPDNLLEHLMGRFFPFVPQKYFSFFDNYIIFSNNISSLHDFLYANVLKKTLSNKKQFNNFRENFSIRENLFIYSEISVLAGYLKNIIKDEYINLSPEQRRELSKFYAGGIQIAATGNLLYSSIYANYLPSRENEPHTIWQSLLDSTVINKPVLVKNHYTNEKELMVQDAKFNLYLINNSGRLLWKKPLDGKILGTIEQIDYYRNRKLQYIFNTKNKIYLLDRNGNSVEEYPIKLPVTATNGIAVLDYDNNRDYRIFLATNDRRVRLFDKRGNKVTGWEFKKTEGTVTQPVQYFRNNSKDYIVFSDNHKVYILNRRGNSRVKPNKHIVVASNCKFHIKDKNTPNCKLISASPNAELIFIDIPTGKTTIKSLIEKTNNFAFTFYKDANTPKYVFMLPDRLKIFDSSGKELVSKTFNKRMGLTIDKYQFSAGNSKLGLTEQSGNHIFLINSNGSTYKGFPLRGSSRFSIGFLKSSSSRFNLVVGGDNNYIFNYRVE